MKSYKISNFPKSEVLDELNEYNELTRQLLYNRCIVKKEAAEIFLNPSYERDINDPFLMHDMEKAADRILFSIEKNEKIFIYGDYDCDGIPGSVILHDFFKKIGYENFENYIPHRHKEGYGLNKEAIEYIAKKGASLLITVDCGITDIEEVELAGELGMDVIITDHHLVEDKLPKAYAILNSKKEDCTYPDTMLCGAGVVWKLVQALLKKGRFEIVSGWEKWLLDMAGFATLSDMVPLVGENRAIAHFGMKVLRKSRRPGLLQLLRKVKINQSHITEDDITFMVAPRINAASRMGEPKDAFDLLSSCDDVSAGGLAEHLHNINDERKWVVAGIMKEVNKTLSMREVGNVVVIGNPKWRIGVLGIVANNIAEQYEKPAFVWGREGSDNIKGSCRSDGSIDVVEIMSFVEQNIFSGMGGHSMSGGFSLKQENVHLLDEALNNAYKKIEKKSTNENGITLDAKLSLDDVNLDRYKEIEKFAPFGVGNPKPLFLFKDVLIEGVREFGKSKEHLGLDFKNSKGGKISAIGFFMSVGHFKKEIKADEKIDLIASIELSMFRGMAELRLRIVDIL